MLLILYQAFCAPEPIEYVPETVLDKVTVVSPKEKVPTVPWELVAVVGSTPLFWFSPDEPGNKVLQVKPKDPDHSSVELS